jgi:hypothetical protein
MLYAAKEAGGARICWAPDPTRLDAPPAAERLTT